MPTLPPTQPRMRLGRPALSPAAMRALRARPWALARRRVGGRKHALSPDYGTTAARGATTAHFLPRPVSSRQHILEAPLDRMRLQHGPADDIVSRLRNVVKLPEIDTGTTSET